MDYQYSLSQHFPNNINILQLTKEIQNNTTIIVKLLSIAKDGDIIYINFDNVLSDLEVIVLNNIIQTHVPQTNIKIKTTNTLIPSNTIIKSNVYTTILSFSVLGQNLKNIVSMNILSYITNGTSYNIKLFDITNLKVIYEGAFTNTTLAINNLSSLVNLPLDSAIIELQVKINSGNNNCQIIVKELNVNTF